MPEKFKSEYQEEPDIEIKKEADRDKELSDWLEAQLEKQRPIETAETMLARRIGRQKYEVLIDKLEQTCTQKLPLLKNYKILLRGDALDYKAATATELLEDVQSKFEKQVYGAVRNKPVEINWDLPEERSKILGLLMLKIYNAMTIAKNYERKNLKTGTRKEPLIIYGFSKFPPTAKEEEIADYDKFFFGETDDTGDFFENTNFVELPVEGTSGAKYEDLFPNLATQKYRPSRNDRQRIKKIEEGRELKGDQGIIDELVFQHHRSYFNVLLIANKILSDVEKLNFETKESVKSTPK